MTTMRDWRQHDPMLQRLATRLDRSLDRGLRGSIERAITRRETMLISRAERNNHRAFPLLPQTGTFNGPILMGHTPTGEPIGLSPDDFTRLTIVMGAPGTGKSLLAASIVEALQTRGIWIFITDAKSPANTVLPFGIPMLDPHEAAITLAAPPGQSHDQWLTRTLHLIESSTYLSSGSTHIRRIIDELMRNGRSPHSICLAELAHILHHRAQKTRNFKEQGHLQSAATALDRLSQADGGMFSSTSMLPWTDRLSTSHGLWLRGLPTEAARVATLATLFAAISHQHHLGINDRRLHGLCVLDDARPLIFNTNKQTTSGVNPFLEVVDTAQAVGISVMLLIQSLAEVPQYLVNAASNLLLIGPIDGNELIHLRPRLELDADQTSHLIHQPKYHAVLHCRHVDFTLPFPLRLPGPAYVLSNNDARQKQQRARQQLLANYQPQRWSPPASQPQPAKPQRSGQASPAASQPATRTAASAAPPAATSTSTPTAPLDSDAHRLLTALFDHPHWLQSEISTHLKIQGRQLTALRDDLANAPAPLITIHHLGRFRLLEPTPHAAQRVGRTFASPPGRDSFAHRWLQARIAAHLKKSHTTVAVEHPVQTYHLDVYARTANGDQICYEVVLSTGNLDDVLGKLANFPGDCCLIVADAKAAKAITQRIAANPLFNQRPPTILTVNKIVAQTKP
jgi:hypothetical protein